MQAGLAAARFVHEAALLILFGAVLFPAYALKKEAEAAPDAPMAALLAVLALAAGVAWLSFTAAGMSGSLAGALDPATLASVLQETEFGRLWMGRLALITILIVVTLQRRWRWRGALEQGLAFAALASLAGTGHARAEEGLAGVVHELADIAHLAAAGFWVGGLLPLALFLVRDIDPALARRVLDRFSRLAVWVVAALLASGAVNAGFLVGGPAALATTAYGRLLSLKLVLVAAMLGLATLNRYRLTPALGGESARAVQALSRLRTHVWIEQALALGVVGLVGALGVLPPPSA